MAKHRASKRKHFRAILGGTLALASLPLSGYLLLSSPAPQEVAVAPHITANAQSASARLAIPAADREERPSPLASPTPEPTPTPTPVPTPTPTPTPTPPPPPPAPLPPPPPPPPPVRAMTVDAYKAYAAGKVSADQFSCLDQMWTHESSWNPTAQNPTSTAYGIAQFLDTTWETVGYTKTSDPYTQIDAGLIYIQKSYQTPCGAWSFWQAHNWY